jgi:hypothetical protein
MSSIAIDSGISQSEVTNIGIQISQKADDVTEKVE